MSISIRRNACLFILIYILIYICLISGCKQLLVFLTLQLSSVEKLWAEGLCASACTASWTSKTWGSGSKVASISVIALCFPNLIIYAPKCSNIKLLPNFSQVEDFTDQSQNVARAVGQDEVKVIYKCIELSLHHIFSFIDGQIGVSVKDLLFGQDAIPTAIPRGVPNLPWVPSQAYQLTVLGDSILTNGVIPEESEPERSHLQ